MGNQIKEYAKSIAIMNDAKMLCKLITYVKKIVILIDSFIQTRHSFIFSILFKNMLQIYFSFRVISKFTISF